MADCQNLKMFQRGFYRVLSPEESYSPFSLMTEMINGNIVTSAESTEVRRAASVVMRRKVILATYRTDLKLAGYNSKGPSWG